MAHRGKRRMKPARCTAPAVDAQRRASICGKPATTERTVEGVALPFCSACAATLDSKGKGPATVFVRLDARTIARVDALASALTLRGTKPNRVAAIRAAILMGLDAFEAERAKGGDHGAR